MASALSYELFVAKQGVAGGIATLDGSGDVPISQLPAGVADGLATLDATGKLPVSQLPDEAVETYKGQYADSTALETAYPTALLADYAYVTATSTYWYWNAALGTPAWVNQQIAEAAYLALSVAERAARNNFVQHTLYEVIRHTCQAQFRL